MKPKSKRWPFQKKQGDSPENSVLKLLRDESGQMLVTTRSPTPAPPVPTVRVMQPPPARLVAPSAPPAATLHCRFICLWCETPLLLPHDRIGLPFGAPVLRRIQARSVASVCSSCGHVSDFSLFRGSAGYDTRFHHVTVQPVGATVLVDWLKCEESTCPFPLPLFLVREEPLSVDEVRALAADWSWTELTCQSLHPIVAPLWLFDHQPHQFPQPPR